MSKSLTLRCLLACSLSFALSSYAQDTPGADHKIQPQAAAAQAANPELEALKQTLADLQKQIEQLRQQLEAKEAAAATPAPSPKTETDDQMKARLQDQQAQIDRLTQAVAKQQASSEAPADGQIKTGGAAGTRANASGSGGPFHLGDLFAGLRPSLPNAAFALPPQTTPSPGARAVPDTQLSDSISLAQGKLRIGALLYADWADYYKSGFGPQFLTQINQLGPGNNGYNTFDISRTYLNFYYSPNDNITVRVTPNIYRSIAGGLTAQKYGAVTAYPVSANENYAFRLKYAYIDIKNLFKGSEMAKGVTLTLGQLQNPLVDWEENLESHRYLMLVPWNYLSLSSTQDGLSLHGPLQSGGKTYLDFNAGVYTQASFHAVEQAETKQGMARVTYYPMGSATNFQGLGLTGFYEYGRSNATPDTPRTIPTYRGVAMAHYATKNNSSNIGFEYDFGRNAFSANNLFSGSGPLDQFGLGTTTYSNMDNVVKALQGSDRATQRGWNAFGQLQLGNTPLQIFGWFENFQPNTEISKNPDDFDRAIVGIQWRVNKSLRFAFDSQNLIFTQDSSYVMPASVIKPFSSSLASANPNGISNVVPGNIHAFFIHTEFSF